MPFLRKVKKYARTATKAAGKRYQMSYGRKGLRMSKNSVSKIAADVQMIKSRLNVEKKFVQSNVTVASAAQALNNNAGYYSVDLTPSIPQGDTESNRNGNSLKITGYHQKIQFIQQQNCHGNRRMKLMLIKSTNTSDTVDQIISDIFDNNPLTGFVDYHSNFNYSNNKKAHKVIKTQYFNLRSDWGESSSTQTQQKAIGDCKFSMKLQDLLRFEANVDTVPKDTRYIFLILVDTGNRSGAAGSNTGVLINDGLSGVSIQHHYRWWYVDN